MGYPYPYFCLCAFLGSYTFVLITRAYRYHRGLGLKDPCSYTVSPRASQRWAPRGTLESKWEFPKIGGPKIRYPK